MNFNFNNQRNFHIGNPIMRHFSTLGLMAAKTDFGLKSESSSFIRNMPNNLFSTYATDANGNKSFSNPNFVNKHHPNILTPSVAGIINFDKPKYDNTPHLQQQQQPKHHEHIKQQQPPPTIEEQTSSSQIENNTDIIINNHDEKMLESVKKSRHQRKKNRRSSKRAKNDCCDEKKTKPAPAASTMMIKKLCSSPKKQKKDHEARSRKSRKCNKPWHKISFRNEILMDCDDLIIPPESPFEPLLDSCIFKSSPIDITTPRSCPSETFTISFSPEILKSLSSSSDLSPASPAIQRLRVPSECESEDSFIVFCNDDAKSAASEQSLSSDGEDDADEDEEYTGSCDSDIDFVDFAEKTDLNHGETKKKVSFKCDKELCTVYPMIKWDFAYRAARKGPWEEYARDRSRFKCRIRNTESILSGILSERHRDKIYQQRFTKNEL